jgi:ligand-binding sensor domain-containing protein
MFKIDFKRLIATATLIVLTFSDLSAQSFSFQSVTFLGNVRGLLSAHDRIWAVTGGGIFAYSPAQNSFKVFNRSNGLSSNKPSSFVRDGEDRLWIGMDDGSLNVISLENETVSRFSIDPAPIRINDVILYDNSLYLAMDFGVSQFLIEKEEIKATFRNLGAFVTNTKVNRLFVFDGRIWAATERGIAVADLASPNLQDPQFWINYSTQDGLPSNTITDFAADGNTILAATISGIVRIENTSIIPDGLLGIPVNSLAEINGAIYAAASTGVYRRAGPGIWNVLSPPLDNVISLTGDNEGMVWAGHDNSGLFLYNTDDQQWINIVTPGPGGKSFEEMIFDGQNRLWAATGQTSNSGMYIFDGQTWEHLTTADGLVSNNTTGVSVDAGGRIWVGTPGEGLMILEKQETTVSVTRVDTTGGRLSGAVTPTFIVVDKIVRGPDDIMWVVNKFADNGKAIAAVTPDNAWHHFSLDDGLSSTSIRNIAFDFSGRLWIATENSGVDVLDYRNSLDDKSDDIWLHFTTNDNLNSNRIVSLAPDREFGMWIGTENGVNYIINDITVQNIRGTIDNLISSIAVDPANNKWFGTRNGISMLASDNFTFTHFTTDNSELVDNSVLHILINSKDGKFYVGTGNGLSIISTPFATPPSSFDAISVYPNPYFLDGSGTVLTIENIKLNSTVLISTISGNVIRTLTVQNGEVAGIRALWDGRDDNNYIVPSGIYIIAAGVSGQGHGVQKVAVIKR